MKRGLSACSRSFSMNMNSILTKMGQELYAALNSGDADALQRLLTVDFTGQLSAGLPRAWASNTTVWTQCTARLGRKSISSFSWR